MNRNVFIETCYKTLGSIVVIRAMNAPMYVYVYQDYQNQRKLIHLDNSKAVVPIPLDTVTHFQQSEEAITPPPKMHKIN